MLEITIKDVDTGRSLLFHYRRKGDLSYTIDPSPKELLKTFGVYELDDIEEFLRTIADDLDAWYNRIDK
jgi:hypothetical protein